MLKRRRFGYSAEEWTDETNISSKMSANASSNASLISVRSGSKSTARNSSGSPYTTLFELLCASADDGSRELKDGWQTSESNTVARNRSEPLRKAALAVYRRLTACATFAVNQRRFFQTPPQTHPRVNSQARARDSSWAICAARTSRSTASRRSALLDICRTSVGQPSGGTLVAL